MQIAIHDYKNKYKAENNFKRQISIDENGFTFKNSSTKESGHNGWDDIARVKELEDYFLVGVNARDAVVIPKRAIRTEREYGILIDLLEGNLNGRFYKL